MEKFPPTEMWVQPRPISDVLSCGMTVERGSSVFTSFMIDPGLSSFLFLYKYKAYFFFNSS